MGFFSPEYAVLEKCAKFKQIQIVKLSITKQIAVVLFLPLLGALAVTAMFYLLMQDTASDTAFIDLAGRQRMLSAQMQGTIKLSMQSGSKHEVAFLKKALVDFGHALKVLSRGGSASGYELPPAAPEIQQSLAKVKKHWLIARHALELAMNKSQTSLQSRNHYALAEEHMSQLTPASNAVVITYGKRSERIRQQFLTKIGILAVLDLLLLLVGISVIRRYDKERKGHELQLRNKSRKQIALRNITAISLKPISLAEQLDCVLETLFDLPVLFIEKKGCIFLRKSGSSDIEMVAQCGMVRSGTECCEQLPPDECICRKVVDTQEPIINCLPNRNTRPTADDTDDCGRICMPIMYGGDLCGVLNLYASEKHKPDADEYDLLSAIVDILASMITGQLASETMRTQADILDNIYDAIASTNVEGFITSWNKGAERMFGYRAIEVVGRSALSLYPKSGSIDIQKNIITPFLAEGMHDTELTMYRKNGDAFDARLSLSLLRNRSGQAVGVTLYCRDISPRKHAERELACRVSQQRGIAELGQHALQNISLEELLDRAVGIVAGVLQVEYCKVLELQPEGNALLLKAGEGWREGLVGKTYIDANENSQAGYTLQCKDAVIVSNLHTETRFEGPQLLVEHDVLSGISVIIPGHDGPYGVFGAHTRECRDFSREDVAFLRTAANVLAEVIERKRAERHIIQSEARFRNLVETSSDWIWEVDEHAVYTYASPRIEDILGYLPAEIIGKTPFDLMPPDEAERAAASYKALLKARSAIVAMENINQHKDGHLVVLETSGVPIYDENGGYRGYRGIDRDITDRKKDERHLEQLAHYDFLTGLPNRALFFDRLRQSLARAPWHNRTVAVMFLDLDRFKIINDTLGHDTGDQLLAEVGIRLSGFVRDGDTVARLGGDEFAIILDDVAESGDIPKIAEAIQLALEKPIKLKGRELFVSTSIGISRYPDDGKDSKLLVTRADIAMYHAKAQGRNNYQFYSEAMDSTTADRLQMETRLRHALDGDEYQLHYQPKLDLASGHICGMEALVRWMTPDEGLMPPYKFIPLLEDTGLIVPVGEWILRTSCSQTKYWQDTGFPGLSVSVNLSARQFKHGDLEEMVVKVLQETGFDPCCLELEITESILMDNITQTAKVLKNLHDRGVRIVIDDFGTGYSSLSYLKQFPISVLKIDRSFIMGITENEEDSALTQAIIAMAHSLGIKVVAEGAETDAQMAFLRQSSCDEVQGYHYSKPLAVEHLGEFLQKNYYHTGKQKEFVAM